MTNELFSLIFILFCLFLHILRRLVVGIVYREKLLFICNISRRARFQERWPQNINNPFTINTWGWAFVLVHAQQASSVSILSAGHLTRPSPRLFHGGTICKHFSAIGPGLPAMELVEKTGCRWYHHGCLTLVLCTPMFAIFNTAIKMPAAPCLYYCHHQWRCTVGCYCEKYF